MVTHPGGILYHGRMDPSHNPELPQDSPNGAIFTPKPPRARAARSPMVDTHCPAASIREALEPKFLGSRPIQKF